MQWSSPGLVITIATIVGFTGCVNGPMPADEGESTRVEDGEDRVPASSPPATLNLSDSGQEPPACAKAGECGDKSHAKDCRDGPPKRPCPESGPEEFTVPYELTDCNLATVAMRIDMDRAMAFVPEGYDPTDGGHKVGLHDGPMAPVDEHVKTGIAVLVLLAADCAHLNVIGGPATIAFAWIDIEPPHVANMVSPSVHDGYYVMHYASDADHTALLEKARMPVTEADVTFEWTTPGSNDTETKIATFHIDGSGGTIAEVAVAATGGIDAGIEFGGWRQDEEGVALASLDGLSGARGYVGKSYMCQIAPSSVLAELLGGSDCVAANHQGLVATHLSTEGWVRYQPGVKAEA